MTDRLLQKIVDWSGQTQPCAIHSRQFRLCDTVLLIVCRQYNQYTAVQTRLMKNELMTEMTDGHFSDL